VIVRDGHGLHCVVIDGANGCDRTRIGGAKSPRPELAMASKTAWVMAMRDHGQALDKRSTGATPTCP
jgi:hypothetical protein